MWLQAVCVLRDLKALLELMEEMVKMELMSVDWLCLDFCTLSLTAGSSWCSWQHWCAWRYRAKGESCSHSSYLLYQSLLQGSSGPRGFPGWPGLKGEKGTRGTTGSQGLRGTTGRRVELLAVLRTHLLCSVIPGKSRSSWYTWSTRRKGNITFCNSPNSLTSPGSARVTWSAWWSWFTRSKGRKRTTRCSWFNWRSG